ncbi:MAG: hypothetical protein HZC01_04550 [Candidatus Kerfeldbacteria bacterium]|nr:hypothetical protein [Candidatus Kerfeldbacteria bacterium]
MFKSYKPSDTKKAHAHLDKLIEHAQKAKSKYDSMDSHSKEKLIAGVAAAISLLGGIILFKKIKGKKDKSQDF